MECWISIGSNEDRERHMELARRELKRRFPDIRFSQEMETTPLLFRRTDPFSNQVACFHTTWSAAGLKECFKQIERMAGRFPADKALEVVRLDIDLLRYGSELLKPDDWMRDYVRQGVTALRSKLQQQDKSELCDF